ncbi:MAG TPA: hypothetical protein VHN99_12205 [Deinococcales bacterium]|nr:hypothetical protein [Deinococcales bacterium]
MKRRWAPVLGGVSLLLGAALAAGGNGNSNWATQVFTLGPTSLIVADPCGSNGLITGSYLETFTVSTMTLPTGGMQARTSTAWSASASDAAGHTYSVSFTERQTTQILSGSNGHYEGLAHNSMDFRSADGGSNFRLTVTGHVVVSNGTVTVSFIHDDTVCLGGKNP